MWTAPWRRPPAQRLLHNLRNDAGADGAAAFADGEAQAFFHGDGVDQAHHHADVVAGHDHFAAFGQFARARHVGGAEVELRAVAFEEGGVTAAFVFAQDVDFGLDVVARGAAEQDAAVVAGLALVEEFAEHFDAGDDGLLGVFDADDFDFVAHFDDAALDATGHHGAAAGDGEDVFDGHEEGAVDGAFGFGDVAVHGLDQFQDGGDADVALVAFEGFEGRADDDRGVVAGEFVFVEEYAHFHFDEVEQFFVVDHVGFVEEHDDVGHADLAGEQDVLTGLGHGAVGGRAHQDGAVHLGRAGDHVLDVVGMTRAVDVGVVAVGRFVFDVRGRDSDAARTFFRRRVDLVVGLDFTTKLFRQLFGQRRRQGGLAMVDVTDRSHVHVRLLTLEFSLGHRTISSKQRMIVICENLCTPAGRAHHENDYTRPRNHPLGITAMPPTLWSP